jgi:hypothetical protein
MILFDQNIKRDIFSIINMARLSGFFAGLLGLIAGGLQAFIFYQVIEFIPPNDNITFLDLVYLSILTGSTQIEVAIIMLVSFICLILMFIILMITKKKTIIVGSIFGILAAVLNILGWNLGMFVLNIFAAPVWGVAGMMLFVGAIMMRKEGFLSIISGLLAFLIIIAGQVVMFAIMVGSVLLSNPQLFISTQTVQESQIFLNYVLIVLFAQNFALGLHGIFIGFSKKISTDDEEPDDAMSVDSKSAFGSYVEDKPKKQKKVKKKADEEIEWTL